MAVIDYSEVFTVYTPLSTYLSGYAYYYFEMLDTINSGWCLTQMTNSFTCNYVNSYIYAVS